MKKCHQSVPNARYMSVRMGQLCVADIREVLPGDHIYHKTRIGVHLSPMQAPELAPLIVRQDSFFCPNRILWDYWDNYISQKLLESSSVGPFDENKLLPPQILFAFGTQATADNNFHLADVRGVYDLFEGLGMRFSHTDGRTNQDGTTVDLSLGYTSQYNAFPLMGYYRIWHDYYRDPFLQNDSFKAYSGAGGSSRLPEFGDPWADEQPIADTDTLVQRNWAAPLASNNDAAVWAGATHSSLPGFVFNTTSPGVGPSQGVFKGIFTFAKRLPAMATGLYPRANSTSAKVFPGVCLIVPVDSGDTGKIQSAQSMGYYAPVCMPKDYWFSARQSPVYNDDVAVPGSVRDLRKAFQLLGYREKINRFDNRIKAWLYNMFHVKISDKRLDSPFWLGGTQSVINTQEILGTMNNTDTVLGQLGGFGIGSNRGRGSKFRSEDHGFLFTLFYIVPLPVYGDGIRRYWSRGALNIGERTPFADGALDWPLPDFARIGQQGIYAHEIQGAPADVRAGKTGTYRSIVGYADRYSDLHWGNSDVCGDFRSTLRFWHTGLFYGQGDVNQAGGSTFPNLPYPYGIGDDFVSLFSRIRNNTRVASVWNNIGTNNIQNHVSNRLFDAGIAADQFWCVVNNDFVVRRRLPGVSNPGGADHTSQPA